MKFFRICLLRWAKLLLVAALCQLAVGCTTLALPQKISAPGSITSKAPTGIELPIAPSIGPHTRPYHNVIELAGRLSLRYEQDGLEKILDGKFIWNQDQNFTRIILSTPFGQTLATIHVTPNLATLTQNGESPRSQSNVDALTASALGWPLPIAGLRDWLQGFAQDQQGKPYVASPTAEGEAAFVNTLDGWLLRYPVWEGARPKRIDLQRLTSQAGNVSLRIVLDQWQDKPATSSKPK